MKQKISKIIIKYMKAMYHNKTGIMYRETFFVFALK